MHRGILQGAALICLLAVMTAAGGCVALYTLSKAGGGPADTDGGVGVSPGSPGTPVSTPSGTPLATLTPPVSAGDGQPFTPQVTVPFPVPTQCEKATSSVADMPSSNATPPVASLLSQTADEEPPGDGPPPQDEIPLPTLPATPL